MATMNTKQIHYWQFDGDDTVYNAPEWRLESAIMETRHKLGLPIWHPYKILKNYAPSNPSSTTATDSSSVSNPSEPKLVSKRTRSRKIKQETPELQSMPIILDKSNPIDLVPAILRDQFINGLSHPVSDSDSLGSDSQETK